MLVAETHRGWWDPQLVQTFLTQVVADREELPALVIGHDARRWA